jgi:hypothetical protein
VKKDYGNIPIYIHENGRNFFKFMTWLIFLFNKWNDYSTYH